MNVVEALLELEAGNFMSLVSGAVRPWIDRHCGDAENLPLVVDLSVLL